MTNDFEASLTAIGWDRSMFENLSYSYNLSNDRITKARADLETQLLGTDAKIDVVAFGSLARREMTEESDLDYLVVVYAFDEQPGTSRRALTIADSLRQTIGEKEIRAPGSTDLFGQMISAVDLVEVIGLQSDTNHSHSRRILFLEESVSLYRPQSHLHLLRSILTRYVTVKTLDHSRMPRFLLNDLSRYWRTLTIDYQAKTGNNTPYSLRYLKLLISRKFTFVSSILPLLVEQLQYETGSTKTDSELIDALVEAYSAPPTVRYLSAAKYLIENGASESTVQALKRVLEIVNEFNGLLGQESWRKDIKDESTLETVKSEPNFAAARQLGKELQQAIDQVFFESPLINLTHKYLVF